MFDINPLACKLYLREIERGVAAGRAATLVPADPATAARRPKAAFAALVRTLARRLARPAVTRPGH